MSEQPASNQEQGSLRVQSESPSPKLSKIFRQSMNNTMSPISLRYARNEDGTAKKSTFSNKNVRLLRNR